MSIWKVYDDATHALMVAYCQRLARGQCPAEAIHRVRLALFDRKTPITDFASGNRGVVVMGERHFSD